MKRIISLLVIIYIFGYEQYFAQIVSCQSGDWSSANTWYGGVIPDSTNDVRIESGHAVIIQSDFCRCASLSFADTSSHIKFASAAGMLSVYGNLTLYSAVHRAFTQWEAGAKITFKGSAAVQFLAGWGSSVPSSSLIDVVINKSAGKVTTQGGNMRFAFGKRIEIVRGEFELTAGDDIETRDINGYPSMGEIFVDSAGSLDIAGGDSYIRRGSFTNADSARTGKWTIHGKAYLVTISSLRINIGNIRVGAGGTLNIKTGGASNCINAGTVIVDSGGRIVNQSTTNVWYSASVIRIEQGAELVSEAVSLPKPPNLVLYGGVNYAGNFSQTLCGGISAYPELILSGSGEKVLAVNTTISLRLTIQGGAQLSTNGYQLSYSDTAILSYNSESGHQLTSNYEWPAVGAPNRVEINNPYGVSLHNNRTISGGLYLTRGVLNTNSTVITIGNGAGIIRCAGGGINSTPVFAGMADFKYQGTSSDTMFTDNELPDSGSVIRDFEITGGMIVIQKDITINRRLLLNGQNCYTAARTIHFAGLAENPVESITGQIIGQAIMEPRSTGSGVVDFLSARLSGTADIGSVAITRVSGHFIKTQNSESVSVYWQIQSSNNTPASDKDLRLSWYSSMDNGKLFSAANKALVWYSSNSGESWSAVGRAQDVSSSNPRYISVPYIGPGYYTAGDSLHPPGGQLTILRIRFLVEGLWNGITSIPDSAVVTIHADQQPYEIVSAAKVLASAQGDAIAVLDGLDNINSYYVAVSHRNSIEIWSSATIVFQNDEADYDFSLSASCAYGSNVKYKLGKYCMYSGDINKDGVINYADIIQLDNDLRTFRYGYLNSDLNGDQFIDISDMIICDNNAIKNITIKRP